MVQQSGKAKKVEILAPAGSYDSFLAAVAAGADAVYAGGSRFGARAFAENFTEEQLLRAIDHAHLHGRRFYLTVNTLLKDEEIKELPGYLEPLYRGGLDAVIVQDVGVLKLVREEFPELCIHASTQMTVTGAEGAVFLRDMGAVRIVPARELLLDEVREMKEASGMELECFVHGALCYSYSGQCLLSSLIGGRSGNRGQCAQPCRLPYEVGRKKGYLLSLKDICTLELLPELIDAGIDSFKIEGRMKRPEYVAGVTSIYRKYTDLYLADPGNRCMASRQELEKDLELLMDLFNRGGFHRGYYHQKNGKDMITPGRPGHAGVAAAKVLSQKGREVRAKALTDIRKEDLIEFPSQDKDGHGYTCKEGCEKESVFTLLAPKGEQIPAGSILYRTRSPKLLEQIDQKYLFAKIQEKIYGFLSLSAGKPAKLTVVLDTFCVEAETSVLVQHAREHPLEKEQVRKQIRKTGNTPFYFERLEILMEGPVFLPMQQLNSLRRMALERLEACICQSCHRTVPVPRAGGQISSPDVLDAEDGSLSARPVSALAQTREQLEVIGEYPLFSRIYLESTIGGQSFQGDDWRAVEEIVSKKFREKGKEVFLALPRIFRRHTSRFFERNWEILEHMHFDGILVRNFEEIQFLRKHGFDRTIILDHNLYIMNQYAKSFWETNGVYHYTIPLELNSREIRALGARRGELLLYGYLPAMVSAQCLYSTVNGCEKKSGILRLKDRYRNEFPVKNFCRDCYNVIYNSRPLLLFDQPEAAALPAAGYRLQFSVESQEETKEILSLFQDVFVNKKEAGGMEVKFTRGHFRRGIT